jgi:hypothetical protein
VEALMRGRAIPSAALALFLAGAGCHSGLDDLLSGGAAVGVIGPEGGRLSVGNGSSLDIPPGALAQPTRITMVPAPYNPMAVASFPGGTTYMLQPEGLVFAQPVTLTLAFDPDALPEGTTPNDLAIFTAPTGTFDHEYWLDSRLADSRHVVANTIHFSCDYVAATNKVGKQNRITSTGVQCGAGFASCVSFTPTQPCTQCQCGDGSPCPNGLQQNCRRCIDGSSCPWNNCALCGDCLAAVKDCMGGCPVGEACLDCKDGTYQCGPRGGQCVPPQAGACDAVGAWTITAPTVQRCCSGCSGGTTWSGMKLTFQIPATIKNADTVVVSGLWGPFNATYSDAPCGLMIPLGYNGFCAQGSIKIRFDQKTCGWQGVCDPTTCQTTPDFVSCTATRM